MEKRKSGKPSGSPSSGKRARSGGRESQTTYIERDLQLEADKLDILLERWKKYQDETLPAQERRRHGSYVRWCGCDPDASLELDDLLNQREIISLEMEHLSSIRDDLTQTADRWRGFNDLIWPEKNLSWTTSRKAQLKDQLENCRASRKKLEQMAYNCQRAAFRRINNREMAAKAERFYILRQEKLQKEKQLKAQLQAIRKKEREARRQSRDVRKEKQKSSR